MDLPVDIYTRSSRPGPDSTSHTDQEEQARIFARTHGLTIGRVLRDDTISSSATLDRPMLQEALRRVEAGESGGIVAAYLSRASRDTRQGLDLLDMLTRAGGAVYAPNLPDYTTADGRMLTTIQLAIDTGYRDRKREELERAKEGAIANGIPVNSRPAVGLRKRRDKRLEHNPRTAPIVREVFERRARGDGPDLLGDFLEENGVKTSQGSRTWSKQAVYGLLKNRVYMGELSYGDPPRYVNPDGVEPIIDRATWEAAQHPNGRKPAKVKAESRSLLAGMLRCQACRYSMQHTYTSRGKRIYRCPIRHAGGRCPEPARVDADMVENAAVTAFWALTDDLEAEGVRDTRGELQGLEAALERAEERIRQLDSAQAQDALGDRYLSVFSQRREERDRAASTLGQARARLGNVDAMPSVETLRGAWERMSVPERRELLALRFHCLALSRDRTLSVYPVGVDVGDLPTRGYKRAPVLAPFPDPPSGVRLLAL